MKRISLTVLAALLCLPLISFGKTVKASSFGFNEKDATSCIQKAIDSGAKEVIIDYTGKDYIVHKSIGLRSNLTLTLEDKVVIRAAKGAFKEQRPLFRREGGANITIRGKGVGRSIIKMNCKDYRNAKLYSQGEHRHIFTLVGVSNVVIRDLTLAESGGDGIYLGGYLSRQPYNKNILVENVHFTGHNRLGIAVISGENVTIRNCTFVDAYGAPPQGGIDLEPNKPNERLVNILIENCKFKNNRGSGIAVAPTKLNVNSIPVSVTIRNCKFEKNGGELYLQNHHDTTDKGHISVKGVVNLENCQIKNGHIQFFTPSEHVRYNLKNCVIETGKDGMAFYYSNNNGGKVPVGNIRFENCVVKQPKGVKADVFRVLCYRKTLMSDKMGGTLYVEKDGKKKLYDFASLLKREIKRFAELYQHETAVLNEKALKVPAKDAPRKNVGKLFFRGNVFMQYAKKGQKITLKLNTRKTGYDSSILYKLTSPSGKLLEKGALVPDTSKVITFQAEETGIYRLAPSSFNTYEVDSAHKGSGWEMRRGAFSLINANGFLYFTVPGHLEEFAIGTNFYDKNGKNGLVRFRDPNNKILKTVKNGKFTIHKFKRAKTAENQIYCIEVRDMLWNSNFAFYKPLQPVISSNKATLFR